MISFDGLQGNLGDFVPFGFSFLSLLVSIATFVFTDSKRPWIHYGLGSLFFLLALTLAFIGLFSFAGDTNVILNRQPSVNQVTVSGNRELVQFDSGRQPSPTQITASGNREVVRPGPTGITSDDLDKVLGQGNWFCLDGFPTAVKIKNFPSNFVIEYPFFQVDKDSGVYQIGEKVPTGGPATGWLQDNLVDNDCIAVVDDSPLTKEDVEAILGSNNWHCLNSPNGFKLLNVPSNFFIQYPLISVDKEELTYGRDETVPAGGPATAWFSRDLPRQHCP